MNTAELITPRQETEAGTNVLMNALVYHGAGQREWKTTPKRWRARTTSFDAGIGALPIGDRSVQMTQEGLPRLQPQSTEYMKEGRC
jgi:hypothetical protein